MARTGIGTQKISLGALLLVFLDILFVFSGLLAGIVLRLHEEREIVEYLRGPFVLARFLFVLVICVISLYYSRLYERSEFSSGFKVFMGLLQALGATSLVLAIVYYLDESVSLGRGIAAVSVPIVFVLMFSARILIGETGLFLQDPRRVLVVGTGPTGISAVREILVRPELNLLICASSLLKGPCSTRCSPKSTSAKATISGCFRGATTMSVSSIRCRARQTTPTTPSQPAISASS
jgi:type IV secretory pathway VirB2 component (pilin)